MSYSQLQAEFSFFGAAQALTSRVEQFVGTVVPRKRSSSRQVHIGGTPLNSVTLCGLAPRPI